MNPFHKDEPKVKVAQQTSAALPSELLVLVVLVVLLIGAVIGL